MYGHLSLSVSHDLTPFPQFASRKAVLRQLGVLCVDGRPEAWKYDWYSTTDGFGAIEHRLFGDEEMLDRF